MTSRRAGLLLVLALWTAPVFGQGCAMCYSSASATTKEGQRAISKGVLVMLLPPLGFMTVGMGMLLQYGRKRDRVHEREHETFDAQQ